METLLILLSDFPVLLEQPHREQEQIVKIDGIARQQPFAVLEVHFGHFLTVEIVRLFLEPHGIDLRILGIRDDGHEAVDGIEFLIQFQSLEDFFEDIFAVRRIVDGKSRAISPEMFDFPPQHLVAEAVERVEPHVLGSRSDKSIHTLPHLFGCLVRKSDGKDVVRCHAFGKQIRDPRRQDLGLAAAGARQN